jgi:hypothetical protein
MKFKNMNIEQGCPNRGPPYTFIQPENEINILKD